MIFSSDTGNCDVINYEEADSSQHRTAASTANNLMTKLNIFSFILSCFRKDTIQTREKQESQAGSRLMAKMIILAAADNCEFVCRVLENWQAGATSGTEFRRGGNSSCAVAAVDQSGRCGLPRAARVGQPKDDKLHYYL